MVCCLLGACLLCLALWMGPCLKIIRLLFRCLGWCVRLGGDVARSYHHLQVLIASLVVTLHLVKPSKEAVH